MKKMHWLLNLSCAIVLIACIGSASAQDSGITDTLRLVAPADWVITSEADSLFTIEVWVWADETVSGFSFPLRITTSGDSYWSSRVDTAMAADTLIKGGGISSQIFTFRRSLLKNVYDYKTTDIDTTKGFVGMLIGLVNIVPASALWTPSTSTKLGDLVLKVKNWGTLPNAFTIEVDSAFYPPAGAFKYSVTGSTGFPPHFVKATINVNNSVLDAGEDIEVGDPVLPKSYELAQNYPNPFNPSTTLKFYNAQKSHVNLTIYNIMGQRVRTLVDSDMDIGWQEVIWDGVDSQGEQVSSGLYFYKMDANDFTETKKMLLVK